ncbi:MAG: M28 family peptidase [Anaerolineales bacterium]|jgi:hypothetical protein
MFIPGAALRLAKKYAQPRLAGTTGDDEIVADIGRFLDRCGYHVECPNFTFTSAPGIFIKLELLLGAAVIISALWIRQRSVLLSTVSAILLLILLAAVPRANRAILESSLQKDGQSVLSRICARLGKTYKTKNVVAASSAAGGNDSRIELILMAHHDSKSQAFPLIVRMLLFGIVFLAGFLFTMLTLLSIFFDLELAVLSVAVLAVVASIPLLLIGVGNDSPGAIDNASGMAIVLHLAEILKRHEEILEKMKITILITGAEELWTMGSEAYVRENLERLELQAATAGLYVINFEGIGVDGTMFLIDGKTCSGGEGNMPVAEAIRQAGESLGYRLRSLPLVGALLDHQAFSERDFCAATILGFGRDSWFVHTREDAPERLSVEGFDKAGRIALGVIRVISGALAGSETSSGKSG